MRTSRSRYRAGDRCPGAASRPAMDGHFSSLVTAAVPTLVFVGADGISGLGAALIATTVSGVLVLGWRLRARRHVTHAVLGTLLAIVCAAVAAGTGQARNFFIVPMMLPAAAAAGCILSILVGCPLAGLVANRIAGGPTDWRRHQPLQRFYSRTTLLIALASCASLAAQVALYRVAATAWLGILHILMAPLWGGITAASIILSRVAVNRYRSTSAAASGGAVS